MLPTAARDLLAYRAALRCATAEHSDVVLGKGQAALGADASLVPPETATAGLGYLLGEDDAIARRFRAFWLDGAAIASVALHCADARNAEAPILSTPLPGA